MSSKEKTVPTTSNTTAEIPAFLKPFLTQAAQTGGRALGDLEGGVQDIMAQLPASVGDLNAASVQEILNYTGGGDPARELAEGKLMNIAGGRSGRDLAEQYNSLRATEGEYSQPAFNQKPVNQNVDQTFQSLMNGNFIGSDGFNANVDASIRAAQPYINSGFGKSGGVGATGGGLAKVAMQRAASDAFANLYGDERNRQMGAAQGLSQAEAAKAQAAAMAAQARAIQQSNRLAEMGMSADLLSQERRNQMGAAGSLLGLSPNDAALLQNSAGFPINLQQGLLSGAAGAIPGNVIGQNTVGTQTYTKNRAGGAIGGATAGAAFGPWGAAAGGILGAIL